MVTSEPYVNKGKTRDVIAGTENGALSPFSPDRLQSASNIYTSRTKLMTITVMIILNHYSIAFDTHRRHTALLYTQAPKYGHIQPVP